MNKIEEMKEPCSRCGMTPHNGQCVAIDKHNEALTTAHQRGVEEEKGKIFKMLCKAMSGKFIIKKSDFGELVDYLDLNREDTNESQ